MENTIYLFSAYSIVWVVIFFYSYTISKRQKTLEKQIAEIKKALRREFQ